MRTHPDPSDASTISAEEGKGASLKPSTQQKVGFFFPFAERGSHCVSCCFERWRALSERDRAGAAAEEEAGQGDDTIFRFTPCQNQKAPYFVAVTRTEGASGEARLRDKARGEEKILIWNPL